MTFQSGMTVVGDDGTPIGKVSAVVDGMRDNVVRLSATGALLDEEQDGSPAD